MQLLGVLKVQEETAGRDLEKELETKRRLSEVLRKEKESLEKKVGPLELALEEQKALTREAQEEGRALALQFESLKEAVYQVQDKNEKLLRELHATQGELEEGRQKQREQEEALSKIRKEFDQMEQALIKGQKEVNAIRLQYQNALQDKALSMQKLAQMQQHTQTQKEVWLKQLEEMRQAQSTNAGAAAKKKELEGKLEQIHLTISEKDQKIRELHDRIASVLEDKHNLQQKVEKLDGAIKEKVADVQEAEQHLAKKVRESSLMLEQNEEQKTLIATLRHELDQKGGKFAELHGLLDAKNQNEKRFEEQLVRLEEKYLKTHEKLQRAEARLKEYKLLEEKHSQMKNLLANLGNFIETEKDVPPLPKTLSIRTIQTRPADKLDETEMDLFSLSKPSLPLKESLFD
jgi:chromosome segregation ATPase